MTTPTPQSEQLQPQSDLAPASPVIEFRRVTKFYGKREVLRDVSLSIPQGCVYGLLGRNGQGKTTAIRILLGMEEATRGTASVFGEDSRRISPSTRARIGYLPEAHSVYGWMTVRENGQYRSSFFPGQWKQTIFDSVIAHFNLDLTQRANGLSRGQRAGLCLALTLAPEPDLLVLDDPALGLDPVARRSLLQSMLYVTRRANRSILFSSHVLADVERVADRIAILDRGVLRADCTLETFRNQLLHYILRFNGAPPSSGSPLPAFPGLLQATRRERDIAVTVANPDAETEKRFAEWGATSVEQAELTLEDAFIAYAGDRGGKSGGSLF
ncbi:MAG: ABC transporter ATP-binding protein [Candidatus Methylacidiphilales bacterium]|nr:ABC transporter ATP-binding protein [Candidatus Methylacidiphilales bacterium]